MCSMCHRVCAGEILSSALLYSDSVEYDSFSGLMINLMPWCCLHFSHLLSDIRQLQQSGRMKTEAPHLWVCFITRFLDDLWQLALGNQPHSYLLVLTLSSFLGVFQGGQHCHKKPSPIAIGAVNIPQASLSCNNYGGIFILISVFLQVCLLKKKQEDVMLALACNT